MMVEHNIDIVHRIIFEDKILTLIQSSSELPI